MQKVKFLLCCAIMVVLGACQTTIVDHLTISDGVRSAKIYEDDKRLKLISQRLEMEDKDNPGQWWEAKKTSDGTYILTAKGQADKISYENQMAGGGGGNGGGNGGGGGGGSC